MESAEKVRLVKCPNCENVLPELPDYSVYQCGGCGAVLRAKGKLPEDEFVFAAVDEESNGAAGEVPEGRSGDSSVPLGALAARGIEQGVGSLSLDQRQSDQSAGDTKPGIVESNVGSGKGASLDVQSVNAPGISLAGEDGGFKFQARYESELRNSKHVPGWRKSGASNGIGSIKNGYGGSRAVRYSSSKYLDEGPSDHNFGPVYNTREGILESGDGVCLLDRDREELLRKLDELKSQLSQSYEVGASRESMPANGSTVCRDTFGNRNAHSPVSSFGLSKMLQQEQLDAHRHNAGLPFFGQYPSSLSHNKGQALANNYDAAIHNPNHHPGFCDHYSTQMHRSCPGQYDRVPPHGLISGQYLDASCDPFGPVPTSSIPHQPSCSCFHHVNNHRTASAPAPPVSFCKGHRNVSPSKRLHYIDNPAAFGSSYIGPRHAGPSFDSQLQCPQFRRPSELNPEGFRRRQPKRVVSLAGGRKGHSAAGGAPFLACGNCFELLQLPLRVLLEAKKGGKFRCGACNSLISYDLANRKLVFSAQAEDKRATAESDDSSCDVIKGSYIHSHGYVTEASYRFSSDELDNSGYDYLLSERARATSTGCVNLSLNNSQEMESISPGLSDQENSPAGVDILGDSVQRTMNSKHSPLPPGSPLQEHLDQSSQDHSSSRFGKGIRSSRSDHENVLSNKTVARQNSLHDSTPPTEVEMPFNELSDNAVTGDSGDANRERDLPKGNKGDSFLSNIFKKSFKDISRPNQGDERGKGKVFVNGHLIPDRSIKKAEKLAGPIHPGRYWYDFRAGFWGVMNGPCLGIIPPYIPEFNYPLKDNCAGGNTGVHVNGRELHQKDMDLLSSRGLPLDRGKTYIVEISGRVYDEDTGEELDCLGKLAPTVEKVKHGFGMRSMKGGDARTT